MNGLCRGRKIPLTGVEYDHGRRRSVWFPRNEEPLGGSEFFVFLRGIFHLVKVSSTKEEGLFRRLISLQVVKTFRSESTPMLFSAC